MLPVIRVSTAQAIHETVIRNYMGDLISSANYIRDGIIYHANNFQVLQDELDLIEAYHPYLNEHTRPIINSMNHEIIAYFNRLGQFYYFAKSKAVTQHINNFKDFIPNIIRFKIFRDKQSAHRATDDPRGENAVYMQQLDRLFTYQYILINKKLTYQILLDNTDASTGKQSISFTLHEDHPKILKEMTNFINKLNSYISV